MLTRSGVGGYVSRDTGISRSSWGDPRVSGAVSARNTDTAVHMFARGGRGGTVNRVHALAAGGASGRLHCRVEAGKCGAYLCLPRMGTGRPLAVVSRQERLAAS